MGKIIDTTVFFGELSIAQITDAAVASTINRLINQYEPEVLADLLGYTLSQGVLTTPPVGRFADLVNGKEYTNKHGEPVKWRGIKEAIGENQYRSLVANYVYVKHMVNNWSVTTGTGEKKGKAENATDDSPRLKIARAWNEMVNWNRELVDFLNAFPEVYPEFNLRYSNFRQRNLLSPMNPAF
jgi:hypothetical protein